VRTIGGSIVYSMRRVGINRIDLRYVVRMFFGGNAREWDGAYFESAIRNREGLKVRL